MPRVSLAFFLLAAFCGLFGMVWGLWMGVTQDFSVSPAHAHLNLVGWTTLALMGGFYALAGPARPKRLSWINFGLSGLGVLLMAPGLAFMLLGSPAAKAPLYSGVILVIAGMISFITSIILVLRKSPV